MPQLGTLRCLAPLFLMLLLATLGPTSASAQLNLYCAKVCSHTTPCGESCAQGILFTTCGDYGLCSGPPSPTCVPDHCDSCGRPALGTDDDLDSVPDRLEHDLAHKYFPDLRLQHLEGDLDETYLFHRLAMPYAVLPTASKGSPLCDEAMECLEIRYGLAYFWDRGDDKFGGSHLGDSEFYAALVRRVDAWPLASDNADSWQLIRDFTAAHWGEEFADSSVLGAYGHCDLPACFTVSSETQCRKIPLCRWTTPRCLGGISASFKSCSDFGSEGSCETAGGGCFWAPGGCGRGSLTCYANNPQTTHQTLFASEGKHATYHTDAECDDGGALGGILGLGIDECPTNQYGLRSLIEKRLQNVGNSAAQPSSDVLIQAPDQCGLYNIWSGAPFGEATAYSHHFSVSMSWLLP